jgi:hypothetical protein
MKRKLSGCMFKVGNNLFPAIQTILVQFERSILIIVSQRRMKKHQICIQAKDDYVVDFK